MKEDKQFVGSLQRLIYKLIKSYEQCERTCLAQHKVTVSQSYTLLALPPDSSLSMNELSEVMGLANSTMTRMVDGLVERGLTYRRPDDEDRRIVRVSLTSQGQEVRSTLIKAEQDFLQPALEEIPEEERTATISALERVTGLLEKAIKSCCK